MATEIEPDFASLLKNVVWRSTRLLCPLERGREMGHWFTSEWGCLIKPRGVIGSSRRTLVITHDRRGAPRRPPWLGAENGLTLCPGQMHGSGYGRIVKPFSAPNRIGQKWPRKSCRISPARSRTLYGGRLGFCAHWNEGGKLAILDLLSGLV